jgi:putative membrane protein
LKQAEDERSKLSQLKGTAFDRVYAQNEVAYHQTVNNALKTTLIPSASNPELKRLLETGLKIFQSHEQHAEHVVADLR